MPAMNQERILPLVDSFAREPVRELPAGAPGDEQVVYASLAMKQVAAQVTLIAQSVVPVVLVLGESGSGKQLVARMLHRDSPRPGGPFVEVNCACIPDPLLESELFGHERGAFSDAREQKLGLVEAAQGGTLLLDEVGDLSPAAQGKVLTFLEQRSFRRVGSVIGRRVDLRIVAATNRDLAAMVAAGSFRRDLYYRLNAFTLELPPLRHRSEDVLPLAEHFLQECNREFGRRWRTISREVNELMQVYDWPGNVRELRAVVRKAALMHDAEMLMASHLPAALVQRPWPATNRFGRGPNLQPGLRTLAEVELEHLRAVLELCGGNRSRAARHLGIKRHTLARKLRRAQPPDS